MRCNLIDAQFVGDLRQILARCQLRVQMLAARFDNLLTSAVGNCHIYYNTDRNSWWLLPPREKLLGNIFGRSSISPIARTLIWLMCNPLIVDQVAHLFLDEVQDFGHFGFHAFEVIQRKNPDGKDLDSQLVAPMEYVFKFIRNVIDVSELYLRYRSPLRSGGSRQVRPGDRTGYSSG